MANKISDLVKPGTHFRFQGGKMNVQSERSKRRTKTPKVSGAPVDVGTKYRFK